MLADPQTWILLVTLSSIEIVLGIDNLVFISIAVSRLPPATRERARKFGIAAACITRVALLLTLAYLAHMKADLFTLFGRGFSVREVLEIAPRYATMAESLRRQHDALHDQIRSIHPQSDTADELAEGIDRLLRALEIHEHAENAVVQSAFADDLAAGD